MSGGFGNEVAASLAHWNLPRGLLELEITEAALIEVARDHESELRRIAVLRQRLVFDGFGMGQFALTRINGYGFVRIKVARDLVGAARLDHAHGAVLRAVISLARDLDLQVVVTGIETAAELAFVRAAGGRLAQGYHICLPVPAGAAGELLRIGQIVPGTGAGGGNG